MTAPLSRRVAAEALGTLVLVATVVGSGIMAERLAGGNVAIALLGNTLPTGAILVVLITLLGPISGAHFNPVVTGIFTADGSLKRSDAVPYIATQIAGGIAGTMLAHAMFELPLLGAGVAARTGIGQWIGEFTATFTLLIVIIGGLRLAPQSVPLMIGLTITAAYWFTSSTSFANPAVTIARAFTPTFAGIAPGDVVAFIIAQIIGGLCGTGCGKWLFGSVKNTG
jgi:glycerol uptake facilitator-like aquaporin